MKYQSQLLISEKNITKKDLDISFFLPTTDLCWHKTGIWIILLPPPTPHPTQRTKGKKANLHNLRPWNLISTFPPRRTKGKKANLLDLKASRSEIWDQVSTIPTQQKAKMQIYLIWGLQIWDKNSEINYFPPPAPREKAKGKFTKSDTSGSEMWDQI